MKFCISFGNFDFKYFVLCIVFVVLEIYLFYFIYKNDDEKIISEHFLLHSFCFFLGYLFYFIPAWIRYNNSKDKEKKYQMN